MPKQASWSQYRQTIGDRSGLFAALAEAAAIEFVLYPGSYVDLSPSTAFRSVTYVDIDRRAARFFGDQDLIRTELAGRTRPGAGEHVHFLAADYHEPLDLPAGGMDLLVSLYAGPMIEHTKRYLRPGGWVLANNSHGDAGLVGLDSSFRLVAVAHHRDGRYRLSSERLSEYLIPKRPSQAKAGLIRSTGRGISYTRSAFAYLFQLT